MKLFKFLLFTSLLLTCSQVSLASVTILEQQSVWNYNVTPTNFGQNGLASVDYAGFQSEYVGNLVGQAAFGNATVPGFPPNTAWTVGTDLALQQIVNIGGTVNGDVTLNLAVDNGAKVFVNGTEVFFADAGGFTSIWEYSQSVAGNLFLVGMNEISVLTSDYGGLTYFDMELVAADGITPIPVPAAAWLFGSALLGLVGYSRKKSTA